LGKFQGVQNHDEQLMPVLGARVLFNTNIDQRANAVADSFEQRAEAALLEMTVAGESVLESFGFHHHKGGATRQQPVLVRTPGHHFKTAFTISWALR
jgi:hypothetical protein